ncbi:redox-sensitive bicupin YhaK (pirin superfamily) [Microbacterium sp. SORGH_AS 505]|uniref:pirin family protein n=1 Tax=Microbacterium sp. SORGH_AS_0505 TaxID=3041770 RepID=UPI00277EC808|nr:pirin family protein [Microbacterium sp. SORGH_AS_0505]MDQ1126153.1 redox-sensitive bicupin YhaK (pirin superfamily) [Microbacterium sp. SORGH_AS_0505]
MTRLDADPTETVDAPASCDGPRALLLTAREVPLGGVRGMQVHRALPQRELPMVGAWCFLDRFGPQVTTMRVEPHPHIGLQTVTWPFAGETRHRDTIGSDVVIKRGQLNIMTSGAGIAHSEYSMGDEPTVTDALQLWVALPESRRHGGPDFERHTDLPVVDLGDGAAAVVVVGELAGIHSPARMYTPIVGAEVFLPAGARVRIPLNPAWEHALVGVDGAPLVHAADEESVELGDHDLLYLGLAREVIEIEAPTDVTVFVLGGEPFESDIVMWWNFVGRSHDEIVAAREEWEADSPRFGHVVTHGDERIPAPPLPTVRLTKRRRRL